MDNIFSKNYNELVQNTLDLSKYSLDELNNLLNRAKEIQEEYDNLQLVVKRNGNSLYGATANEYYSLHDVDIAEDITMGAKHFTVIVDKALNNFLQNWGEKELKIIQEFYPNVTKLEKFNYVPDKIDYCIYGDTDSRYCDDEIIFNLMGMEIPKDDKELSDFIDFFNKRFGNSIVKERIDFECELRNARKGFLKMNHEVTMRKSTFIKKKKYILTKIWENGKFLKTRKMKFQGVELKKGAMSKRMKKILGKLVEKFLVDDFTIKQLRIECLKLMANIKQRKEIDIICLISSVSGLNNVKEKSDGTFYSDKNHIQMQIMLSWMNFIKENNLIEHRPPFDGQKMYYYYCADNEKYKVIGIPDDVKIKNLKNLPEPNWNLMINKIMIKPLLRYILDKSDISDIDCEHFLLGVKELKF